MAGGGGRGGGVRGSGIERRVGSLNGNYLVFSQNQELTLPFVPSTYTNRKHLRGTVVV